MAEVAGRVARGAWAGRRALVVGGSRGLGELMAKLLAAAGAFGFLEVAQAAADRWGRPLIAVAAVVGVAGGMTKMDLANEGSARSIELLRYQDMVGVFAVDSEAHEVVPLAELASDLQGRSPSDLHAVALRSQLSELQPVQAALNRLGGG